MQRNLAAIALALTIALPVADDSRLGAQETPSLTGEALFTKHCGDCHEPSIGGAPTIESMKAMSAERLLASLRSGVMQEQAAELSDEEMRAVVGFLAVDRRAGRVSVDRNKWSCEGVWPSRGASYWVRWGRDAKNSRFTPADAHRFDRSNVAGLRLAWAFGFPDAVRARSQPVITENMIYLGSQEGTVFALDRERGCVWWTFSTKAEVRSSLTLATDASGGTATLYFGDFEGNVYALDADSGKPRWQRSVADHRDATITGSIAHHDGMLFVPMSSTEIISAYYKEYECCTFRGGVLALRAEDGEALWRMYTTREATKQKRNSHGVQLWGPSGAPVWSAPTVDSKRGLLYVGTGENYSTPANDKSDAIIALHLATGKIEWVQQTIAGDAWNGACVGPKINCPEEDGPDFDFGAPPILATVDSRDYVLAGQKSGMIFAMDPDDGGKILWQRRLGMGGFNGGVHWGMSVSGRTLIVPITDTPGSRFATGDPRPGLHALDVATGEEKWSTLHPATCTGKRSCYFEGLSAAVTTTDELAFAASLNGVLSAYNIETGERIWSFETRREFETTNAVEAAGGSIDSAGAVIAGDDLYINSGYDKWGQFAGNVFLAFELAAEANVGG